jgi:hypothetical protein
MWCFSVSKIKHRCTWNLGNCRKICYVQFPIVQRFSFQITGCYVMVYYGEKIFFECTFGFHWALLVIYIIPFLGIFIFMY